MALEEIQKADGGACRYFPRNNYRLVHVSRDARNSQKGPLRGNGRYFAAYSYSVVMKEARLLSIIRCGNPNLIYNLPCV